MIELRHNDLVGIGAVIEKDDLDINTKMVFKLFVMPMKTDFPKELSPTIDATQIFELKSAEMLSKGSKSNAENLLTDVVEPVAVIDKADLINCNGSGSPEYFHTFGKCNLEEQLLGSKTTSNDNLYLLINQESKNKSLLFEDEIVISDDEEFLFSQSMMNKVKEELAELDNDVICLNDESELDDDMICLESKEVFDSWRQSNSKSPINVEDNPDHLSHFQPSTLNWMYSQSDVILCRKKTGIDEVSKTKPECNSKPKVLNSKIDVEKTSEKSDIDKISSEKSKAVKTRSSTKKKKATEEKHVSKKSSHTKGKSKDSCKMSSRDSRKPSSSKPHENETNMEIKKTSSKILSSTKTEFTRKSKESSKEVKTRTSSDKKKRESDDSNLKEIIASKTQKESRTRSSKKEVKIQSDHQKSSDNCTKGNANTKQKELKTRTSRTEKKNESSSDQKLKDSNAKQESVESAKNIRNMALEQIKNSNLRRRSKSLVACRSEIVNGKF